MYISRAIEPQKSELSATIIAILLDVSPESSMKDETDSKPLLDA